MGVGGLRRRCGIFTATGLIRKFYLVGFDMRNFHTSGNVGIYFNPDTGVRDCVFFVAPNRQILSHMLFWDNYLYRLP